MERWRRQQRSAEEEETMELKTVTTADGRVIAIQVDENLDLTVHSLFAQACELVADPNPGAIEVNVGRTLNVRDSGLAMLLMLKRCASHLDQPIKLVNCSPELRNSLLARRMDGQFSLG
jgi:hypothetical protein